MDIRIFLEVGLVLYSIVVSILYLRRQSPAFNLLNLDKPKKIKPWTDSHWAKLMPGPTENRIN